MAAEAAWDRHSSQPRRGNTIGLRPQMFRASVALVCVGLAVSH